MIVSAGFVKNYPRLAAWICDNLPKVKQKAKVLKAFQKYAESDEKVAHRALEHGNPPTIDFRYMGASNGQYLPQKYPEMVFIAVAICKKFEESETDATDPRMHLLLESTLLHEMVHWGDWKKDGKESPFEAGKEFEKEAYGKDIGRYW